MKGLVQFDIFGNPSVEWIFDRHMTDEAKDLINRCSSLDAYEAEKEVRLTELWIVKDAMHHMKAKDIISLINKIKYEYRQTNQR